MSFLPVYIDSSALLKLALPERETGALRSELARWPDWVTSRLTAVECRRAVRRAGGHQGLAARVEHALACCTLLAIDETVLRLAETIGSAGLGSLDAIHLASALSLGDDPAAFVVYDARLAAAARAADLKVISPGGTQG